MALGTVEEIERAIDALTEQQLDELYEWLDQKHPQTIDARLESDLMAGRLEKAISTALEDEKTGRIQPL